MANFFPDLLERFSGAEFLKGVREKYHYGEEQTEELQRVAKEMLPLLRREAFWERQGLSSEDKPQIGNGVEATHEKVVISLGSGIDDLQESYSEKEMLSQSYMIEVLASEVLLQSYEIYNRYVREHTETHVARYYFPGSDEAFSIVVLPELLSGLTDKVTCNTAFCMRPKKSVVFVSELTKDETVHCRGVCFGCNSLHCQNRMEDDSGRGRMIAKMADLPLTYGYSRILGRL